MNGSIRVSAKTVDDAITEALIQLGVTSDRLEYEVIEKGSAGFFGIGMKQAVIEARRKPEEVKEEEPEIFIKKDEFTIKEEKSDYKKESKREHKKDYKKEPRESKKKEHQKPGKKDFKKDEFKKDNLKKDEFKKEESRQDELKKEDKKEFEVHEKPAAQHNTELAEVKDETKKAVEAFLSDTLKAMDMSVELITEIDADGALSVEMKGDNMGILIGKRGQTLDALQYLANRVANKHQEGYVRVKLDTENYRARREETLKNLAKNIAYKVKRTRRAVSLEPMNPYERRIIHAALQSDPYVTTHSEGEEPYRKVVVTLKREERR